MSTSVTISIVTNSVIMGSKLFGFMVTGSPTLFAETVHSLADVGNQILLRIGEVRAHGRSSPEHPFGVGRERFFWALVSAVSVFFLGCGVTIYHGVDSILNPGRIEPFTPPAIGLLLFALALELYTFRTAWKEIGGWTGVRENRSNTSVLAVLAEDSVAVVGILLTLFVVATSQFFGPNATLDAVVSIGVGLMLGAMAIWLANLNRRLLIGVSDPKLNAALASYLERASVRARVTSVTVDVDRFVVYVWVSEGIARTQAVDIAQCFDPRLQDHARETLGKTIDAVFWKFPAAAPA